MIEYNFQKIAIDDFDSLYKVMEKSFPSIERRDYEGQKKLFYKDNYNVLGYKNDNNEVCAFLAYWKFENFNFIEHFAVNSNLRGNGIGTKLFKDYLRINIKLTVLEVEVPEEEMAVRRVKYYEKLGMKLNHYDYMQPPLQKNKELFPLKIMSYKKKINSDEFEEIKRIIYSNVYKYNENNEILK